MQEHYPADHHGHHESDMHGMPDDFPMHEELRAVGTVFSVVFK